MEPNVEKSQANRQRWDGRPGFYEVWYLKWNDLPSRTAGWIRYTLTSPAIGRLASGFEPVAELWGMFFDATDPSRNFAGKQTWPAPPPTLADQGLGGNFLALPGGAIGRRAAGRVQDRSGREFSWDLAFDSAGPVFYHLPYDWMYRGGFPKTKPVSPHQDARVSGTVTIDGRSIQVESAPGQQTHIWGERHALCWAWGHCNIWDGGAEAVWEGLDSRVMIGPWRSPSLSLFFLRAGGREYRFNTFASLVKNQSRWLIGDWTFRARSGEFELLGSARAEPEGIITVTYTDPNGDHLWCRNTKIGSLDLSLRERGKLRLDLRAAGTAAVEFVDRRLQPGEKVGLD